MTLSIRPNFILLIASAFILFFFTSCSKGNSNAKPANTPVTITSLSTTSGPYNTAVTITGTGFSTTTVNDEVFFNNKAATISAATATTLTVIVPLGAGTGVVSVSVNNGTTVVGPTFTYELTATVTTVAGNPTAAGYADGKNSAALFNGIWGMVIDANGDFFVADYGNLVIRKITPDGTVTTFAGIAPLNNIIYGTGETAFFGPDGMAIDAAGNIYVADESDVRKITTGATVSILTQEKPTTQFTDVKLDASGNLYSCDIVSNQLFKVSASGTAAVFAGTGAASSIDGTLSTATFDNPYGLAIDSKSGNIYVADESSNKIRKITPAGVVSTLAGSGLKGAADGAGGSASFNNPSGLAVDATGNVYVADFGSNEVRKITLDGTVSTIAGSSIVSDKDGIGTAATFSNPNCLAFDSAGNLYVGDNNCVRKITFQ